MGQQQDHPQGGDAHTMVRTPTGDAHMDADQSIRKQKELDERQAGHQQAGKPSGKQQQRTPAPQRKTG